MSKLIGSVELNGVFLRVLAGNLMDSAGQECREIWSLDSASFESVESEGLGLNRIVKISVNDLRSGQIASLGVINVEILILCIGEDGREILVRSASAQLNLSD